MPRNLEIAFVDTTTPQHQQQLDAIRVTDKQRAFDVYTINGSDDGIDTISTALSRYQCIHTMHVISRSFDSSLMLGSTRVDQHYLDNYCGIFRSWSDAFSANARIRLYGRGAASSVSDRIFIRTLARLTGTDVVSQEDTARLASLGADWFYEFQFAAIEKSLAS